MGGSSHTLVSWGGGAHSVGGLIPLAKGESERRSLGWLLEWRQPPSDCNELSRKPFRPIEATQTSKSFSSTKLFINGLCPASESVRQFGGLLKWAKSAPNQWASSNGGRSSSSSITRPKGCSGGGQLSGATQAASCAIPQSIHLAPNSNWATIKWPSQPGGFLCLALAICAICATSSTKLAP